ncbi:hypothetical protein GF342_01390 [Candidatus Woesearchaeota archaeon]|nr:hypothetical protein [Candidatus Woesearchaeota archaeon]
MKWYLAILSAVFLVLAVACSKPICETDNECPVRAHFTVNCIDENCSYTPIPNECGNTLCDGDENYCRCPSDCRTDPCEGIVTGTQYLEQSCDAQDECTTDVKEGVQEARKENNILPIPRGGGEMSLVEFYKDPFNVRRDDMEIEISLTELRDATDHRVKRIEVRADGETLGSVSINRPLHDVGKENGFTQLVPFNERLLGQERTVNNIEILVDVEFVVSGVTRTEQVVHKWRGITLTYVQPTAKYACPASCDDGNAGTRDYCSDATDNRCMHEIIAGACGNGIADPGETRCTCPQDVGTCDSLSTNYLQYSCLQSECRATVLSTSSIPIKPQRVERALGNQGEKILMSVEGKSPFNVDQDRIIVTIEFVASTDIPTLTVHEVLLEDRERNDLGIFAQEQTLSDTNPRVELQLPVQNLPKGQSTKEITVDARYSYGTVTDKSITSRLDADDGVVYLNP